MKKLLLVLLPVLFLFSACKYEPPCYSVAVAIDTDDENTIFISGNGYKTKVNTVITGNYFWLPSEPKDTSIKKVVSTDENIISITAVDYNECTFTALAKQTGEAVIRVYKNDNHFSSSLRIIVEK